MAIHKGSEGVVKVGTATIAEVTEWSLNEQSDPIETTNLAATARTYVAGKPSASGSITCHFDSADTSGQGAMTPGSTVSLNLFPNGDGNGNTAASFSALITSIDRASGGGDGIVSAAYNFTASGSVAWATVSS